MIDGTIPVRAGEDLDRERVERYLRRHLPNLPDARLELAQFPSGASNLTYAVRIGGWEAVLRRPPLGPVPPRAHDMVREAALLERIHPAFPLAPRPFHFCTDLSVIGAPFYLMERRRGIVLDGSFPDGVAPQPALCRSISETAIRTLAAIHAVDWQAAGLAELGHPEGFLQRQVQGWIVRYDRARTDDVPSSHRIASWLTEHVPAGIPAALIHNDFKLNNMLLDPADLSHPVAVLDWEMATVGDPLLDLAITLSYWTRPQDPLELRTILPTVTTLPGFLDRDEMMRRYVEASGRDLSCMPFYLTFATFKLAAILQQIYARWKHGQTTDQRFAAFGRHVTHLMEHAEHQIDIPATVPKRSDK